MQTDARLFHLNHKDETCLSGGKLESTILTAGSSDIE